MRERLKTWLLFILVATAVAQFSLLLYSRQDVVRVIPRPINPVERPNSQLALDLPPEVLAAPIRILAHLPGNQHKLLRSSSRYYANTWNTCRSILGAYPTLIASQFTPLEEEAWNVSAPSVEILLSQALPLKTYLAFLGVNYLGDESLNIDRLYFSASGEHVYLSDGVGGLYHTPWKSQPDLLTSILALVEASSSPYVQLYALPAQLSSVHQLFVLAEPMQNTHAYNVVPLLRAENYTNLALKAFADPTSLRMLPYSGNEETIIFENFERRLRFDDHRVVLEQWDSGAMPEPVPLWQQAVQFLREVDIMPAEGFYFDGLGGSGLRSTVFFQQAHEGRPLHYLDYDSAGEVRITSSLRAEENNGLLASLRYRPFRVTNAQGEPMAATSQQQAMTSLLTLLPTLPGGDEALPPLRDIVEGFLCSYQSDTARTVWIVEFVGGRRYFFDVASGDYIGYLSEVSVR